MSASTASSTLVFFINGSKVEDPNVDPELDLLSYLRQNLRLTGSKRGCGEGACGACTVMMSRYDSRADRVIHISAVACLVPVCAVHGWAVTTVEALASETHTLQPIQRQLAESHGIQCGFCTPGMLMSVCALVRSHATPTDHDLIEALQGNLCRCTGYRPILEGFKPFVKSACGKGKDCCQNKSSPNKETCPDSKAPLPALFEPSQALIFPPQLKIETSDLNSQSLHFKKEDSAWYRPSSLADLAQIRRDNPDANIVCGNTQLVTKNSSITKYISITHVNELNVVQQTDDGMSVGAAISLTRLADELQTAVDNLKEHETRGLVAMKKLLAWFASKQIRNIGSIGGSVAGAEAASDINPLLLAMQATLQVLSADGKKREVLVDDNFFRGSHQTALKSGDTIISVVIPYTFKNEYVTVFKQSSRCEFDRAVVNAAMRIAINPKSKVIEDVALVFGGIDDIPSFALKTMKFLKGRVWERTLVESVCSSDLLTSDLPLTPGANGGMVAYRRTMTHSFFFRFYLAVTETLGGVDLSKDDRNAHELMQRATTSSSQVFEDVPDTQSPNDAVGRPMIHLSAHKSATGQAVYTDDTPPAQGEVYAGFVLSSRAHAKVTQVDISEALFMTGVLDFVTRRDVPGDNVWCNDDDLVFADSKVIHEGQVIGVIIAESPQIAQKAANKVKVEYEDLDTVITIEEAIAKDSFFACNQEVNSGDVTSAWGSCDHVLEGETYSGAQEHLYLEPQSCVVTPKEDDVHVLVSTQALDSAQSGVAKVLGISANQVHVNVKRIGGGFGGKNYRHNNVLLPAAVAAFKLKRPVRAVLPRGQDMRLTGTRHPVLVKYKVGITTEGKLQALEATVYLNCGATLECSRGISTKLLLNLSGAYSFPHFRATARLCKTNIQSRTPFRGAGIPEAVFAVEGIMDHVAAHVGASPMMIRKINFMKEGCLMPYGQPLTGSRLLTSWKDCELLAGVKARVKEVEEFNSSNKWKKRGISMVPLIYGVGFPFLPANKASVLVNVYSDGSVLIISGGVEMGQGLHTKLVQIASRALDLPPSCIRVAEASTDGSPNSTLTAGSMTSDLIGGALVNACEQLKQRLETIKTEHPSKSWNEIVKEALNQRMCLSVVGELRPKGQSMDWSSQVNSPFLYHSFGTGCTEVELDCLTGAHQVLRTDIVMDVGKSLNPAVDIGQIEGAFVQGYGWLCTEQYNVSPQGKLLSASLSTYKVPTVSSVPQTFNVKLLKGGNGNPKAVYSSKAIGEPPLCLAVSAFLAVKDAVRASRVQSGGGNHFTLDAPATPSVCRMACGDQFASQFSEANEQDKVSPWSVRL